MTIWQAARQPQGSLTAFSRRFTAPTVRDSSLQWMVAGVVGMVLGICVVGFALLPQRWAPLFILVVLSPFILMIAGNVEKFLLAIILLEIPLGVDINFAYREAAAALGAVGGFNLSLTTLCLAFLYALWLAQLLAKAATPPPLLIRKSLPLIAYIAIVALSAGVARDTTLASFYVFMLLQALLLYIYVVKAVRTREDVRFVVFLLLTSLALQGLIIVGVRLTGIDLEIASVSTRVDADFGLRGGGTLGSPNSAAGYLTLLLAPALSVLIAQWGRWAKWLAVFAFGLGGAALFITQSRGGWAAFATSVTLFYLLAWRRGWLSPKVHFAAIAVVLMLAVVSQGDIVNRLSGNDHGAAYSRVPLMRLAFQMIGDNLLLGVGANNFVIALPQYITPDFSREWLYTVHNKYLLVWAEAGTGALMAFVWFLAATLWRGWQGWRLNDRLLSSLSLGFMVAIVGHMVHMTVDIFNDRPHVQMLWLIAGLITAISSMEARAKSGVAMTGRHRAVNQEVVR